MLNCLQVAQTFRTAHGTEEQIVKTNFLGVRLEESRMAKLRELAEELNASMSAVVRALIDNARSDQIYVGDATTNPPVFGPSQGEGKRELGAQMDE